MTRIFQTLCLLLILMLNLLNVIQSVERRANFDVFAKSVKSSFNKDWVSDFKLELKSKKEKPGGVVNVHGYLLQRIDEVLVEIRLFYRYGTIYRTYLIDYKRIEGCELVKKKRSFKYSNPLADIAVVALKQCCPQFNHECPYYPGYYNGTNIDINGTIAPNLPPVVPAGKSKPNAHLAQFSSI